MNNPPKTVLILSGGMDSVTLLYWLINREHLVQAISFDYGQRHSKELAAAALICNRERIRHHVIDVSILRDFLGGSALTDDIDVPEGHYEEESMRATVVPNRNLIMLSIAWGYATSIGADYVATAVHAGDHFIYPDCRPSFILAADAALHAATEGMEDAPEGGILAPFINIDKGQIAEEGYLMKVPYEMTWTCYKGGEVHCGKCGACVERQEALGEADPTLYEINQEG
jgi:7-cyano-7-deazaguanine synthase